MVPVVSVETRIMCVFVYFNCGALTTRAGKAHLFMNSPWKLKVVVLPSDLGRQQQTGVVLPKYHQSTVRSESRCALRLRYVDLFQACIDARGHHFQHLL
jgi:hypothetical protein